MDQQECQDDQKLTYQMLRNLQVHDQQKQLQHYYQLQHTGYTQQFQYMQHFQEVHVQDKQHIQQMPHMQQMHHFQHMQCMRYYKQILQMTAQPQRYCMPIYQVLYPFYYSHGSNLSYGPGPVQGNTSPVMAESPSTSNADQESCTSQEETRPTSDVQKDVHYERRCNNEVVIKFRDAMKSLLADLEACALFLKQEQANLISGAQCLQEAKADLSNIFVQFQELNLQFCAKEFLQGKLDRIQNPSLDASQDPVPNYTGQEGIAAEPVMANASTSTADSCISWQENSLIPDHQKDETVNESRDVRISRQDILTFRDTLLKVKSMVKEKREENTVLKHCISISFNAISVHLQKIKDKENQATRTKKHLNPSSGFSL